MNLNATFVAQLVVFFVLAWVTMTYVWPPIIKAIDERRKQIADGLAAADDGKKSLTNAQTQILKLESDARARAVETAGLAEKRGASIVAEAETKAKTEGERIVAAARAEAAQEMARAKESLRNSVADLAVKGAEKILRREVDAKAHADLLNQLKAEL